MHDITFLPTPDDAGCGVTVGHDGTCYWLTCHESGELIASTPSAVIAVGAAATWFTTYTAAEPDPDLFCATVAYGHHMFAELAAHAQRLEADREFADAVGEETAGVA